MSLGGSAPLRNLVHGERRAVMGNWFERLTLPIHLAVIFAGFAAFAAALMTGEWRLLLIVAFAYWFTVKT
jgi:hypothetical protein